MCPIKYTAKDELRHLELDHPKQFKLLVKNVQPQKPKAYNMPLKVVSPKITKQ